jgi:phosphate transport system permease protein
MTTTWDLRGESGEPQPVPPHSTYEVPGSAPEPLSAVVLPAAAHSELPPSGAAEPASSVVDLSDARSSSTSHISSAPQTTVTRRIQVGAQEPTAFNAGAGDVEPERPRSRVKELPRDIGTKTVDDRMSFWGSLTSSFALVWVLYYQILPFTGRIGFVVLWWVGFLAIYAGVTAMSNPPVVVKDRLAGAVVSSGALIVFGTLATAIVFTFGRGIEALLNPGFFTHDMAGVRPTSPLDQGGILHAIVGSIIEVGIAIVITLPLGVGAAVYMNEVGGRFSRVVRTIIEAMTALPSVVAGLFIYTVVIVVLGFPRTGIAAALAISVMMLPIIARSADVVIRTMPGGLREASLALGSSKWQTVKQVVLPTVRPGLATALILGIARGVGETSPVLLTSGASTFLTYSPVSDPNMLEQPMNSLPLFVFSAVRSSEPLFIARGFGAAAVLMVLVLILFVITRWLARERIGRR